jgi:hypothetical protein
MPKGSPKMFRGFRLNSNLYLSFKDLATKNGYTVTEAFEKFMTNALQYGLIFPSAAKPETAESEARIMLSWLKQGQYWVNLGGKDEESTVGRLLQLLPNIQDAHLKLEAEEVLKNSFNKDKRVLS